MIRRQPKEKVESVNRSADISYGIYHACCIAFCALFSLAVLVPLLHVIASSFSSAAAISGGRVYIWPIDIGFAGYEKVFGLPQIWRGYANSLLYVVMSVSISISVIMLTAFLISRREFALSSPLSVLLIISMLFSGGMIPSYIVVMKLGLLDTPWALVLPGALVPMYVFMALSYIRSSIPGELFECSRIDGCSYMRYLLQIVVPLSKPIIAVLTLWVAVGQWNSYFNAMLYLNTPTKYPLQLVLRSFLVMGDFTLIDNAEEFAKRQELRYQLQYVLIIISTVPVMILYPFVQKHCVKGIMIGSVKG